MSDYIPDYAEQYAEYEARLEREAEKLPKCDCCGERIVEEKFYNFEGTYICMTCIDDYLVDTEDYIEE